MSDLDLTHLRKLVARAAEVHGSGPRRLVLTDHEAFTGVAPVCTSDDHVGTQDDIEDCCTGTDIETHSVRLAELLVALLNQAPAIVADGQQFSALYQPGAPGWNPDMLARFYAQTPASTSTRTTP